MKILKLSGFGVAAAAALLAWRGTHDYALTKGLRTGERMAGIPLGIASDAIYSSLFLTSAAIWIVQGKSALSSGSASSTTAAQ